MDTAQTWTLIGGFFAIFAIFAGLLTQTVRATIKGEIAPIAERIGKVETRMEYLDRDVQVVISKWGRGEEPSA